MSVPRFVRLALNALDKIENGSPGKAGTEYRKTSCKSYVLCQTAVLCTQNRHPDPCKFARHRGSLLRGGLSQHASWIAQENFGIVDRGDDVPFLADPFPRYVRLHHALHHSEIVSLL